MNVITLQTSESSHSDAAAVPLVELRNAGVMAGDRWLVRGVNLSLKPGEIISLIGPNGSGKTSTARLVLGIRAPSEGSVTRRPGLRVGYVPQKVVIDWTMPLSVRDFMDLTEALDSTARQRALEETGAGALSDRALRTLSGGEFQRVLLARALARRPELLVLDEPVQGVDFAGEIELYELIRRYRDETGCGVLMISHDLHVVMAATDQVICLNGHVCCHGAPEQVALSSEYQRLFGNRAAALAVYQHRHDHTHLADGRILHGDGSVTDHCHPGDGHHDGHHHVGSHAARKGTDMARVAAKTPRTNRNVR